MVKKVLLWIKTSQIWLITAQIYALFLCPFILFELFRGGSNFGKYIGAGAFVLILLLLFRYELYKKRTFLLYSVFFLFTYAAGFLSTDSSISRIIGSPQHRAWYICLLAFIVSYVMNDGQRKRWLKILFGFQAFLLTAFFIVSIVCATKRLFDPEFKAPSNLGIFVNGRLSALANANTAGEAASVLILISLILLAWFLKERFRFVTIPLCTVSLIVGWITLGMSYSRSAMLSTSVGIGAFAFVILYSKASPKGCVAFLKGLLLFAVVGVACFFAFLLPKVVYDKAVVAAAEADVTVSVEETQDSLEMYGLGYALDTLTDRTLIWPAAIGMLNEKPIRWIIGVTAQNVHEEVIFDIYEGRPEIITHNTHSGYVQQLYVYGIPGVTLLVILLISWIVAVMATVFSDDIESDKKLLVIIPATAAVFAVAESFMFPHFRMYPITFIFFTAIGAIQGNMSDKGKTLKGKIARLIVVLAVLSAGALLTLHFYGNAKKKADYVKEIERVEQDPADFVRLNNGILTEMMTPEYWVENRREMGADTDGERLSFSVIQKYNYDNRRMIMTADVAFSLYEIGEDFYLKVARSLIGDTYFIPDNPGEYLLNGRPTDSSYWDGLVESLNLEALDSRVSVKFGYSVTRSVLKRFPTDDEVFFNDENLYYDQFIQSDLQPFMPVAIIHESADGEWCYVLTYGYGGWTRKENVALCKSREDWLARQNPEKFLVVTGKELRLPTDPYTKDLSDLLVPMGTVIPVVSMEEAPEDIHNRIAFGNYVAKLPARGDDGTIVDEYILIPASEDVNLGYLPYTEENVAKLSFKHLGAGYGWGGAYNGQDCSGYVREVYACFGFELPRAARTQADYACEKNYDVSRMSVPEKLEILKDAPIGTFVFFPGHIMMYLGTVDGMPYCISSAGNFSTLENGEVIQREVNTVILTNMIDTKMADGRSWIESITKITIP